MYYDGYYLNIQYVPLPPGSHGASTPNPDGSYTVFLDPNDSTDMQAYGFWKELNGQIKKGHYDNIQDKEAGQVELEAHDIEPDEIPKPEAVEATEPAKPVWPPEEPEWPDAGPVIDAIEFAQKTRYLRILRDNMIHLQVLEELRSLEKEEKKKHRVGRRKKEEPEEASLTQEDMDTIRDLLGLPRKSWFK